MTATKAATKAAVPELAALVEGREAVPRSRVISHKRNAIDYGVSQTDFQGRSGARVKKRKVTGEKHCGKPGKVS